MGKAGGLAVGIIGLLIILLCIGVAYAVFATNMLLIVAGPFLLIAIVLMAIGVYLEVKGTQMYKKPSIEEVNEAYYYQQQQRQQPKGVKKGWKKEHQALGIVLAIFGCLATFVAAGSAAYDAAVMITIFVIAGLLMLGAWGAFGQAEKEGQPEKRTLYFPSGK